MKKHYLFEPPMDFIKYKKPTITKQVQQLSNGNHILKVIHNVQQAPGPCTYDYKEKQTKITPGAGISGKDNKVQQRSQYFYSPQLKSTEKQKQPSFQYQQRQTQSRLEKGLQISKEQKEFQRYQFLLKLQQLEHQTKIKIITDQERELLKSHGQCTNIQFKKEEYHSPVRREVKSQINMYDRKIPQQAVQCGKESQFSDSHNLNRNVISSFCVARRFDDDGYYEWDEDLMRKRLKIYDNKMNYYNDNQEEQQIAKEKREQEDVQLIECKYPILYLPSQDYKLYYDKDQYKYVYIANGERKHKKQ